MSTEPALPVDFSVRDQVVLISGGTRGIGRAIAVGFAQQGARVILTGRQAETVQAAREEFAQQALPVDARVCDVADSAATAALVDQLLEAHGRIDTLVNVAGVNRRRPVLELQADDYDFVLNTNLRGAFMLAQQVGRSMVQRRAGCQIHIASLNSDRPLKNVAPYAMSKAALAHMTRSLALEWGPYQVRVNAIAPGFILTDLTRKLWSDPTMHQWGTTHTPLGRLGQPEDMVGTAIFLASPAAAFLTGQILYVDGGFTAGWSWPIPV